MIKHDSMNSKNFKRWFGEKLLPNLEKSRWSELLDQNCQNIFPPNVMKNSETYKQKPQII